MVCTQSKFSIYKNNLTYKVKKHKKGICIDCSRPVVLIAYVQQGQIREERTALLCYEHLLLSRERNKKYQNYKNTLAEKREIKIKKAEELEKAKIPTRREKDGTYARLYPIEKTY